MIDILTGEKKPHDPGGRATFPLMPGVDGKAEMSPCGKYRYWLSRDWGFRRHSDGREPYLLWIGCNPSTALGDVDDPTIRREMAFTKRIGYSCLVKVNIMDYRVTDPKVLLTLDKPRSEKNLECIAELARKATAIIVAWGAIPKPLQHYADETVAALGDLPMNCLGVTADGSPRHPLFLLAATRFQRWTPRP